MIRTMSFSFFFFFSWHTTKYGDPYSEFVLCIYPIQSAHTHTHTHTPWTYTHTHTVNTHPEQWAAIYGVEFGALLKGTHLSRGIEGGESTGHSLSPSKIPAGPRLKLATFGLDALTIRPRLPPRFVIRCSTI